MNLRRGICIVAAVGIFLPTHGSRVLRPDYSITGKDSAPEEPSALRELRRNANKLFLAGEFLEAAKLYQLGYDQAVSVGSQVSALRSLHNLGSAYYKMYRYRDAIRAYLEARPLAESTGDRETLGTLSINLSSLYLHMGELEAAEQAAAQGLKALGKDLPAHQCKLLIQMASLRAARGERDSAEALFQEAVSAAQRQNDHASEAHALNELGNALLDAGEYKRAAAAMLEAFRIRKSKGQDDLHFSYESLGRLKAAEGDFRAALSYFNQGIAAGRAASTPVAMWTTHFERGKANLALSRAPEAYRDLAGALRLARRWRAQVLPADAFRVSSNVELHDIYSLFVEAGNRLYDETGRKAYASETFAAAEENRAASLRALLADRDGWTKALPEEYWQTLSRLHAAEVGLMNAETPDGTEDARKLRLALSEMEARAGVDSPADHEEQSGRALLTRARAAIAGDSSYFGFHLGEQRSFVYALAQHGFEVYALPGRQQIASVVAHFTSAVAKDAPSAPELGRQLYKQLFGPVAKAFLDSPVWILALDRELFEAPLAALVKGFRDGVPIYAIEAHALQVTPGLLSISGGDKRRRASGPFIGVGDPIYNRADPRWKSSQVGHSSAASRSSELSRLVASGEEVEACARLWRSDRGEPVLLRGEEASKRALIKALEYEPAVLHLATHVVVPELAPGPPLIALALGKSGEVDYLSATEIAKIRARIGLVVLNGCNSGRGAGLPGAGLMGLTRAWMVAGAGAVIASRWPTPDHSGELFQTLYSLIGEQTNESFARALQRAQLAQLRSSGWRSRASYWSSYFCVERN
jgi:CHAT domain-containing protein/tetratricopeptide (TPR) repeat protein